MGFMNFIKIVIFIIIFIGVILSIFEKYSKSNNNHAKNQPPTEKTVASQQNPAFSQPTQPLPQTGDNNALFINGVARHYSKRR